MHSHRMIPSAALAVCQEGGVCAEGGAFLDGICPGGVCSEGAASGRGYTQGVLSSQGLSGCLLGGVYLSAWGIVCPGYAYPGGVCLGVGCLPKGGVNPEQCWT